MSESGNTVGYDNGKSTSDENWWRNTWRLEECECKPCENDECVPWLIPCAPKCSSVYLQECVGKTGTSDGVACGDADVENAGAEVGGGLEESTGKRTISDGIRAASKVCCEGCYPKCPVLAPCRRQPHPGGSSILHGGAMERLSSRCTNCMC